MPLEARSLSDSIKNTLETRMKLYATAAVAAGVSVLALSQPAESEVIITKKHIPIPVSSFNFPPPQPVLIDLNHDGINDLSFSLYSFAYHSFNIELSVRPLDGGAAVAAKGPRGVSYASALMRGAKIGPSAHFSSRNDAEIEGAHGFDASSQYSRHLYGNWGGNPKNRYLGVRFLINGETHYGWVRLTVTTEPRGLSAAITAYAYETEPNKRIVAGVDETAANTSPEADLQAKQSGVAASLGMLALGADAIPLWRRDETVTVN